MKRSDTNVRNPTSLSQLKPYLTTSNPSLSLCRRHHRRPPPPTATSSDLLSFLSVAATTVNLSSLLSVSTTSDLSSLLSAPTTDTYRSDFSLPGAALRAKGLNRIGNLLVPDDNYCKFEDWIIPIFDKMLEEQSTKVF